MSDETSLTAPDLKEDPASQLIRAVLRDPVCATLVDRLPTLGLREWWLTGGAVFQNVWNHVEGLPPGYGIKDYDVFYFDSSDPSWEAEDEVIRAVDDLVADIDARIEVRNEARVHMWYEQKFGVPAKPFTSATDAINAFASTTCCVGITKDDQGIMIHAPHGLVDIFTLHMRPNPQLAPKDVYETKVREYRKRWPSLTADPWSA